MLILLIIDVLLVDFQLNLYKLTYNRWYLLDLCIVMFDLVEKSWFSIFFLTRIMTIFLYSENIRHCVKFSRLWKLDKDLIIGFVMLKVVLTCVTGGAKYSPHCVILLNIFYFQVPSEDLIFRWKIRSSLASWFLFNISSSIFGLEI